jgi:hypothetical protein
MQQIQCLPTSHEVKTANYQGPMAIDQLDRLLADLPDPKCIPIIT